MRLQNRLETILSFIRPGVTVLDVGTDHAQIPIALAERGHTGALIASDVAAGPVRRAEVNIRQSGYADRITVRQTDGLEGLTIPPQADIVLAGMGGELIASILEAAPGTRQPGVRLILQPMTKPECLSRYLGENGYAVTDGAYVRDSENGKLYRVMVAGYTGIPYTLSPELALLGAFAPSCHSEEKDAILRHEMDVTRKKIQGKEAGGADASEEKALLLRLEALREPTGRKGTS